MQTCKRGKTGRFIKSRARFILESELGSHLVVISAIRIPESLGVRPFTAFDQDPGTEIRKSFVAHRTATPAAYFVL